MTYKEALKYKSQLPSKYIKHDIEFIPFIAPLLDEDFASYLEGISGNLMQVSDEESKHYSINGEYLVIGLFCDGSNIIKDPLIQ